MNATSPDTAMDPRAPLSLVWPVDQPEVPPIVAFGYFSLVSLLAGFLALRGRSLWRKFNFVQSLVFLILLDAYIFVYFMGILVLGIGTSAFKLGSGTSHAACEVAMWWCILVYSSGKLLITLFLMERVHLVHSITYEGLKSRWKSRWYLAGCGFFVLWQVEGVLLILGRNHEIRQSDGACRIGFKLYSSAPGLALDVLTNIFLTAAFIIPVYRSKFSRARRLAGNSCIAAVAALATSVTNISIIVALHGHELAWVCLVSINSAIIFFITSPSQDDVETDAISKTVASPLRSSGKSNLPIFGRFHWFGMNKPRSATSSVGVHVCSEVVCAVDNSAEDPLNAMGSGTLAPLPKRYGSAPEVASTRVELSDLGRDRRKIEWPTVARKMSDFDSILESPREEDEIVYGDEVKFGSPRKGEDISLV